MLEANALPILLDLAVAPNSALQSGALKVIANLSESGKKKVLLLLLLLLLLFFSFNVFWFSISAYMYAASNAKQMCESTNIVPLLKVLITTRNISLIGTILYILRNLTKSGTHTPTLITYHRSTTKQFKLIK